MNYREIHHEFEIFLKDLFTAYEIPCEINKDDENYNIDLILSRSIREKVYAEVKTYRSKKVHISQIKNALTQLIYAIKEGNATHGILIISSYIEIEIKKSLELDFGITIWDRKSLYNLTEHHPDLRARFENQLTIISQENLDNIFDEREKTDGFVSIGNIWDLNPKQIKIVFKSSNRLCKELHDIPSGKKHYKLFEQKCQEILEYIFDNDLTTWYEQQRTDDGLNQYDLICRIASIHDFWKSISNNFNSKYILFEFKNYKKPIKQGQVYTTEKYLYNTALRSVGFIIAKNGADRNAHIAMKGALREHGKLLICIKPEDLCKMLKMKDSGDDPNTYMAEIVDDFLIKIGR